MLAIGVVILLAGNHAITSPTQMDICEKYFILKNINSLFSIDLCRLFLDSYIDMGDGFIFTAITILIIDTLYQRRERRSQFLQLIRLARSRDNLTALQSLDDLKAYKMLKQKTFRKYNLSGANLENVQLFVGLDMTEANLSNAILVNANLHNTILNSAILSEANLRDADLISTKLRNASLIKVILENAILRGVDLSGAVLSGANLKNAQIEETVFDEKTILPDGKNWTPKTDLARFTNP